MADFPKIGDFSGPQNNSARLPRKEPEAEPTPEEAVAVAMNELDKATAPPSPEDIEKNYMEGLKAVGLDIAGARRIMEDIVVNDYYEEKVKLGSVSVVLRTRSYNDTVRMTRFLEVEAPTYQAGVQDLIARYNTVSSLVSFGERAFNLPKDPLNSKEVEASFDERYSYLLGKPAAIVGRLMDLVYRFDLKIQAVFSEGAPQDF